EDLRREHAGGYRVHVEVGGDATGAERLRGALAGVPLERQATERGVTLVAPELEPSLLQRLAAATDSIPGAELHVEQPQMTDIFRKILARRAELGASPPRGGESGARTAAAEVPA